MYTVDTFSTFPRRSEMEVPGRILSMVGLDQPFDVALAAVTGKSLTMAVDRYWNRQALCLRSLQSVYTVSRSEPVSQQSCNGQVTAPGLVVWPDFDGSSGQCRPHLFPRPLTL